MKRLIMAISLIVILCIGVYSVVYMEQEIPITYDGRGTDVYELQQNPYDYDVSDPEPVYQDTLSRNSVNYLGSVHRH